MPVGKGSIARATSASAKNNMPVNKVNKDMADILTNILVDQINSVPQKWMNLSNHNQSVHELMQSMQKYGVIEPVILRRVQEDQFQLLSGYRRVQAAKEAGMRSISARIIDGLSDKEAREIYDDLHKKIAEDNIHEAKFKAVATLSKDMPTYLL